MVAGKTNQESHRRRAGVCLHVTSLPGAHGIGDIGASAYRFIDHIAGAHLDVWQFLPIGPTGFGNSPYQSLSTFAGNEMLIDLTALVQAGLLADREIARLTRLPRRKVDFDRLIPAKSEILNEAAARFSRRASAKLKSDYDRFLQAHDDSWLHDYALFRVLKTRHAETEWLKWPARYRDRDRKSLKTFADENGNSLERVKVCQFFFYDQWRQLQRYAQTKGIRLFGDMPIYVAQDSADAWASRSLLQLEDSGHPVLVAGVPPDYFSEDGQLWGNPVYNWDAHAASGYDWWIRRFGHYLGMMDLIRIDHFRGFEAFFAIASDQKTARNGQWFKAPGDELFTTLQGALGDLPVIAEDLGVITPEVDALRRRHQFPGMKVLQFEVLRDDFDITDIETDRACYTGTHDNDTTLGWYRGNSGSTTENRQRRKAIRERCNGRAASIHHDMIRLAFASDAQLAIAPMQDFAGLGSTARLNTPGTSGGNWRWRVGQDALGSEMAGTIANLVDAAGRRPNQ